MNKNDNFFSVSLKEFEKEKRIDESIERAVQQICGQQREIIDLFCKTFISAKTYEMNEEDTKQFIADCMKNGRITLIQKQTDPWGFSFSISIDFNATQQ